MFALTQYLVLLDATSVQRVSVTVCVCVCVRRLALLLERRASPRDKERLSCDHIAR